MPIKSPQTAQSPREEWIAADKALRANGKQLQWAGFSYLAGRLFRKVPSTGPLRLVSFLAIAVNAVKRPALQNKYEQTHEAYRPELRDTVQAKPLAALLKPRVWDDVMRYGDRAPIEDIIKPNDPRLQDGIFFNGLAKEQRQALNKQPALFGIVPLSQNDVRSIENGLRHTTASICRHGFFSGVVEHTPQGQQLQQQVTHWTAELTKEITDDAGHFKLPFSK